MIYSMTGYGNAKEVVNGFEISVELKSVNNRYLDLNIRLPKGSLFAETYIRDLVSKYVKRGKIDMFINVRSVDQNDVSVSFNQNIASAYLEAAKHLINDYGVKDDISALSLLRLPDVLETQAVEVEQDILLESILQVTEKALGAFNSMRELEGNKLFEDLNSKLQNLSEMRQKVEKRSPETVSEYRVKLYQKMQDILSQNNIDEYRIMQEAAIYADKVAVDEEMVRLKSHISQFSLLLQQGSPVGKKMDFLIQEMNREANTTGSKCIDSEISAIVIEMKSEIEKIREQVQNIE